MFPTGILLSPTRFDLFHQLQKPFGAATPVESKSYLPEPFLRPKSNELAKPKPSSSPAGTTPKRQAACSIVPRVRQLDVRSAHVVGLRIDEVAIGVASKLWECAGTVTRVHRIPLRNVFEVLATVGRAP